MEEIDETTEKNKRVLAYLESYAVRLKELLADIIHDTMN